MRRKKLVVDSREGVGIECSHSFSVLWMEQSSFDVVSVFRRRDMGMLDRTRETGW